MSIEDQFVSESLEESRSWEFTSEAFGWIGVIFILTAYCLATFNQIAADSLLFMGLNLLGAIGVAVDAYEDRNVQSVVLNIIWAVIAVVGLVTYFTS